MKFKVQIEIEMPDDPAYWGAHDRPTHEIARELYIEEGGRLTPEGLEVLAYSLEGDGDTVLVERAEITP